MSQQIKILAVDPSSTCCGVALFNNGKPTHISHFVVNKKLDLGARLFEFGKYLDKIRAKQKLDAVAIEQVTHTRNVNTIRMLSYFGAATLMKAGEWRVPTFQIRVKEARKEVFQTGIASKEYVYQHYASEYKLPPFDKFGNDESDALCIGEALIKKINKGKISLNGRK